MLFGYLNQLPSCVRWHPGALLPKTRALVLVYPLEMGSSTLGRDQEYDVALKVSSWLPALEEGYARHVDLFDAENADTGQYQQSEKACLVTAFQEGLSKCRQYLRNKTIIQSSWPRYNVNSESDWRTVVVTRIKSFPLPHHQICINSPAAQAVTDTPWCRAGRRTQFTWQGSCGCSHHYCHTSHSFLSSQL